MKMRGFIAVATALAMLMAIAMTGCSSAGEKRTTLSGGKADASPAPTLTKSNLPTAVGTRWNIVRKDVEGSPLSLDVKGPWKIEPGADWEVEDYQIVDPKTVPGIDKFKDYTYVLRVMDEENPTYYYPRTLTDDWVIALGRIESMGDDVQTEVDEPANFWPLRIQVGQKYTVMKSDQAETVAEVLARNSVEVPAGKFDNGYLVRFRTTLADRSKKPDEYYYIFAPDVGMVAYFNRLVGTEDAGFTAAGSIIVLNTKPAKQ